MKSMGPRSAGLMPYSESCEANHWLRTGALCKVYVSADLKKD